MTNPPADSFAPGIRPLWVPPGLQFDTLSASLQQAIVDILNPAYQELVLEAPTPLERSTGLSYVHLLWLELIDQQALGKDMSLTLPHGEGIDQHQAKINRHIALITAKGRVGKFLLEIVKYNERVALLDPLLNRPR